MKFRWLFFACFIQIKLSESIDVGDALIITKLLKDPTKSKEEIQAMATINNAALGDVVAYSGFFTVNEALNSNYFFTYVECPTDTPNTPIILWMTGEKVLEKVCVFLVS